MRKILLISTALLLLAAVTGCDTVDKRLIGSWIDEGGVTGMTLEADLRGSINNGDQKTPMIYMQQGDKFYISFMDPVEISDLEFDQNAISTIRSYINSDTQRMEYSITFFGSYEFVLENPPGSGNAMRYRKLASS